jgi:SAM-dependent methyltransferase
MLEHAWRQAIWGALQPNRQPLLPKSLGGMRALDLGCGRKKLKGAVGIDLSYLDGVDIVSDLERPLPIATESVDIVYADQTFEHVRNLIDLVYEVHRILKPGGRLIAHVPYFRSSWAHVDPTHVRMFTVGTMDYFVSSTAAYKQYRFREGGFAAREVLLDARRNQGRLRGMPGRLLAQATIQNPGRLENSFWSGLAPFQNITYVLTK